MDAWMLRLVAAVERYEDYHPKFEDADADDWRCLGAVLNDVPSDVRKMAMGYDIARREDKIAAEG